MKLNGMNKYFMQQPDFDVSTDPDLILFLNNYKLQAHVFLIGQVFQKSIQCLFG